MRVGLCLAILPWLCAAPAAAAPNADRLAARLVGATDLRSAVAATEKALVAGGVAVVTSDGRVRPGASPAAPVTASGMEVLHLAVEGREKATAGRMTLPQLATALRAAGFPFGKPRRAARSLQAFLGVWVRHAKRHKRDPRSFTPRFLAAMAKRQSRPVNLAKRGYPPAALRLTQLEVKLLVAAFQRGPRRFWRGSARPRTLASAAQAESSPCSDYRAFQKEQLKELYGEKTADDLDKILDYGFGMIAGELTNPVMEKGMALGIEQGILHNRWRARPGQRAKGLSTKFAKRLMTALNVLQKVQKLAALYGSVGIQVFAEEDPGLAGQGKSETVHKPYRSKQKRAFAALVGIDPDKQQDYEALKQERAKESDMMKALRDCVKLLGLPSLTDTGDVAEEMEKWRVKWSFRMLSNHAEINIRDTKYDAGSFKQKLRRLNAYQATAGPAYVNIKPEDDRDHEGCQPPVLETYVTATAALDMSQPPGLGTAIDVATGNVLGVALEAAQQMFLSLVKPSASATLVVEYHVRDKATTRQADQVCKPYPPSWDGTASGTFTRGDGITTSWSATFTEFLQDQGNDFALYNNWPDNDPARAAGTITWSMQGTDSSGCTVSGAGITGIGVQLSIQGWEDSYADRIAMLPGGSGGWKRDCPGPPASSDTFTGHPDGPWICSPKGPYTGQTMLTGEDPAVDEFFFDRRVTGNCKWTLTTP